MVALAMFLRYTPNFGINNPNPFYMAEAAYIDAGITIAGWENDKGMYLVMAGKQAGELISYDETGHGLGSDMTGQIEFGRVDYTGNPNNFDPEAHIAGYRDKFYFGVEIIGGASGSSLVDAGQNRVWYSSISLGLGISAFGPISTGVNSGETILKNK